MDALLRHSPGARVGRARASRSAHIPDAYRGSYHAAPMKYVSSSRRQIVMAVLLGLAALGAAIRHWAPNPSLARDIGTLMLVLWLPAVGNLVAFVVRKLPRRAPRPTGFEAASPFAADLIAKFVSEQEQAERIASLPAELALCTLVVGNEGFTARTSAPLSQVLTPAPGMREVPLQLLRPSHALPRLAPGTRFQCLVGSAVVSNGTVERMAV